MGRLLFSVYTLSCFFTDDGFLSINANMITTTRIFSASCMLATLLVGSSMTASAQCAAGQVEVDVIVMAGIFSAEQIWTLQNDATGDTLFQGDCGGLGVGAATLCLNEGQNYTFTTFDDYGDGWNGGTWTISRTSDAAVIGTGAADNGIAGDMTDNCIGFQLEESFTFDPAAGIAGCTDSTAINYNTSATIDDGSCLYPAANDACSDAIDIPAGTCYNGTNDGATFGGDTLDLACIDGSATPADIWFTTTVGASGAIQITLPVIPGFSSIFELYFGDCDTLGAGILSSIGLCNNYSAGGGFTLGGLPAGAVLYMRYWDFGSDQEGAIRICVDEPISGCNDPCATNFDSTAIVDDGSCVLTAIDADDCSAAEAIVAGSTPFNTDGATGSDITLCTLRDSISVWFAYTVPAGLDTVNIWTCGSSFDTGLSLWNACGGTEIACNDDDTPVSLFGSECDGASNQSYIALTDSNLAAYAGTTIYIRLAGYNGARGCGVLNIEEIEATAFVCEVPQNPFTSGVVGTTVFLNWEATPGAVGYRIKGGPVGGVLRFLASADNGTVIGGSALGSPLAPATCYEWRVRAKCADDSKSGYSTLASFCTDSAGAKLASDVAVTLYPNPANDKTLLRFENATEGVLLMEVSDINGKVFYSEQISVFAGKNQVTIMTGAFPTGSYFIQLQGQGKVRAVQLEVAH